MLAKTHILLRIIIVTAFVTTSLAVFAQSESDGFTESYLQRPIGARAIGLGGAFTSIANDPNAVFFNPGGLTAQSSMPSFSTMFSSMSFGRYHSTFAYAQNLTDNFGVGVGFNLISNGSFTRRDKTGSAIGTATNQQYSASLGAAYDIGGASFGISGKYMRNVLQAENLLGEGFAFDAGVLLPFGNAFTFGASVQNIGSITWNNTSSLNQTLPYVIRAGISTEIPLEDNVVVERSAEIGTEDTTFSVTKKYVLFTLEGMLIRGNLAPNVLAGVEYSPVDIITMRGGIALMGERMGKFTLLPMTVYSAGLSYNIESSELPFVCRLDYSFMNDFIAIGGISHHISLNFGF